MPLWSTHLRFIKEPPYIVWYTIRVKNKRIGAIYITKRHELGVYIIRDWRRKGYGQRALELLMDKFSSRRFYANIGPKNIPSQKMFEKMGFKLVQYTFQKG